jgi:hypothetical protein
MDITTYSLNLTENQAIGLLAILANAREELHKRLMSESSPSDSESTRSYIRATKELDIFLIARTLKTKDPLVLSRSGAKLLAQIIFGNLVGMRSEGLQPGKDPTLFAQQVENLQLIMEQLPYDIKQEGDVSFLQPLSTQDNFNSEAFFRVEGGKPKVFYRLETITTALQKDALQTIIGKETPPSDKPIKSNPREGVYSPIVSLIHWLRSF